MRFSILILIAAPFFLLASPAGTSADTTIKNIPAHDITLRFDLARHLLTGSSRITIPAGVPVMLFLNGLDVSGVMVDGRQFQSDPEKGVLELLAAGQGRVVEIFYSVSAPPDSGSEFNRIAPDGISLTGRWMPISREGMRIRLTVTVPDHFSAVTEAEPAGIGPGPEPGSRTLSFAYPETTRGVNFVAGPYQVVEEPFAGNKVLASYFFKEDEELAETYREKARSYLERYEKLIGPYPYQRFSIVENRLPTGYAMPSFTLLGQAVVRLPFIADTSLGHEVLHQWFGNAVRVAPGQGNWAEGLTAYLADHSFAGDRGEDDRFRLEQIGRYQSYVNRDNVIPLRDFHGADDSGSARELLRAVGYSKATMFFHMVKNHVGEAKFYSALRNLYQNRKFQEAGWSDLQESFEKAAHVNLAFFFDQWLTRTDIPEIELREIRVREQDGHPYLSFTAVQKTEPHYYDLTLPVTINTPLGGQQLDLLLTGPETPFEIMLDEQPEEIIVDRDFDLMRTLSPAESAPTWSRFIGAQNKTAVVAQGVDEVFYEPLLAYLRENGATIVREADGEQINPAGALIFLGQGTTSRSLFALRPLPRAGFALEVRNNPLEPATVAVIVSSSSAEETEKALAKLRHYGKYSSLHLISGRMMSKDIAETTRGQRYPVEPAPVGVRTSNQNTFPAIIDELFANRVVYVGETHTSYPDHQLQLRIVRALYARDQNLAIGMEMFNRSSQGVLDEYIAGKLTEKEFLKQSNYFSVWSFDYRYYREIIDFARHNKIPLIGLNQEREAVSRVFSSDEEKPLTEEQRRNFPVDMDLDMPGYQDRLSRIFRMHSGSSEKKLAGFVQAQALWDETMAETAADFLNAHPDHRMVIIAGKGHVDRRNAIPPRLHRRLPVRQVVVVNSDGMDLDPEFADFHFFSSPAELPPKPLIGVQLIEDPDQPGATIAALSPAGQAEAAGIQKGDIILAIDDEPVETLDDVKIIMLYKDVGSTVRVKVKRPHVLLRDEIREFSVFLAPPPKSPH